MAFSWSGEEVRRRGDVTCESKNVGKDSPTFRLPHPCGKITLTMGIDEFLAPKRDKILNLAAQHGADTVRVFGSFARGEAGPESDVDFLVHMGEGRSLFDLIRLKMALESLLGRDVDVLTDGGINRHAKARILGEAIPL